MTAAARPGDEVVHILFHHGVGELLRLETHVACPMQVCAVVQWGRATSPTCESLSSLQPAPTSTRSTR